MASPAYTLYTVGQPDEIARQTYGAGPQPVLR